MIGKKKLVYFAWKNCTSLNKDNWGVSDDLVATGGTLIAACDLLSSVGATIVECACMVELKMLGGYQKLQAKHPGVKVTQHS